MSCEPWPIVWPCENPAQVEPEQMKVAEAAAQQMLWARTGRRLGLCTVVEGYRPAPTGACGVPWMDDRLVWHNAGRGGACCSIHLVTQPVWVVTSVSVLGQVLAPGQYVVEGGAWLRSRVGCWPAVDACAEPPVVVTYQWGIPLRPAQIDTSDPENPVVVRPADPLWGLAAAAMGEVANEVLNGMCGRACKLPSRAVTINRQGVTVELGAPGGFLEANLLGLPLADELIRNTNPGRLQDRSRVFSPDLARRV